MWKISDFKKIFNFIKTDEIADLDDAITKLAKSEHDVSKNFFKSTLDQLSFDTVHYNRLRYFLIDWYTSLKTMTSVQKNISDIYGMPDEHLDEAFRSKGFNFSTKLSRYGTKINYNKVNFYYDLVNLYKKKGSPKTLLNTLRYFGFPNIEILEYMTYVRRSTKKVEFHSLSVDHTGKWHNTFTDILTYDEATGWDPHYLTSEKSIVHGQQNSKLHLPSPSPYFSLRHYVNIDEYSKLTVFLSRKVQDQYKDWHDGVFENTGYVLPDEVYITSCTMNASILELYLACIYTYHKHYGSEIVIRNPEDTTLISSIKLGDHNKYFNCFDGTDASYLNIVSEYEDYVSENPLTRDEIRLHNNSYLEDFARLQNKNFLVNENSAEEILQLINPELFNRLIDLYDIKPQAVILGDLLEDLMKWVNSYYSIASPHLNYLMYGSEEFKRVLNPLIDFFKPYHARLLSFDINLVVDDKSKERVIADDNEEEWVTETVHDWDTCNSKPCCNDTCEATNPLPFYARDTYDCGSFFDIGGACDGRDENAFTTLIDEKIDEKLICGVGSTDLLEYYDPNSPMYGIDPYVETDLFDIPSDCLAVQSGNFISFDDGGCFDNHYGNDLCFVQVIE